MSNFYQEFRQRVNAVRRESRGQGSRVFVGTFGPMPLSVDGKVELPEDFNMEQSDELVVGLNTDGDVLMVYESFLWQMLDDLSDAALKASFEEMQIRSEDPVPAIAYLGGDRWLSIPDYLLEAADIRGVVRIEGKGIGFRLSRVLK